MYRRTLVALVVLLVLGAACQAVSTALQPSLDILLVPGATDVQVSRVGWQAWQIDYYAPGLPYTWYSALAQDLKQRGWTSRDSWYPNNANLVYNPIILLRFQQVYL